MSILASCVENITRGRLGCETRPQRKSVRCIIKDLEPYNQDGEGKQRLTEVLIQRETLRRIPNSVTVQKAEHWVLPLVRLRGGVRV